MKLSYTYPEKSLVELSKSIVSDQRPTINKNSSIIFVFGENQPICTSCGRSYFLKYAEKKLNSYLFLKAEDFITHYKSDEDLLKIEQELSKYSDCIIIFLESIGSFTELGAFSTNDELCKKILVINLEKYEHVDSFVNHGPIHRIKAKTKFEPIYCKEFNDIPSKYAEIENSISKIKPGKGHALEASTLLEFENLPPKEKFLFIHDLIYLLQPITAEELRDFLNYTYKTEKDYISFVFETALLQSFKMIEKVDGFYKTTKLYNELFTNFRIPIMEFKAQIIQSFAKKDSKRLKILTK